MVASGEEEEEEEEEEEAVQRTLAVTSLPSVRAWVKRSRTREEPLMRVRMGDCTMVGVVREGLAKRMRREGKGRTRRYCR